MNAQQTERKKIISSLDRQIVESTLATEFKQSGLQFILNLDKGVDFDEQLVYETEELLCRAFRYQGQNGFDSEINKKINELGTSLQRHYDSTSFGLFLP